MCGNINPNTTKKASKAIGPVDHVFRTFESQTMTVDVSHKHTTPSFDKDLVTVESETVFVSVPGRHHTTFKLKCGLFEKNW